MAIVRLLSYNTRKKSYEKKYKNALKILKTLYAEMQLKSSSDAHITSDTLREAFSEFRFSVDERVAKAMDKILGLGKAWDILEEDNLSPAEAREWLKKHRVPEVKVVIPKFRVGDVVINSAREPWQTPNRITAIQKDGYNFDGFGNCGRGFIGFSFENEYELVEQKPILWSKEDDRQLNYVRSHLEYLRDYDKSYRSKEDRAVLKQQLDWLCSLPQRIVDTYENDKNTK